MDGFTAKFKSQNWQRKKEREREREKEMSGGRNERSQRGMNGNKLSLHLKMKK